MRAYSGITVFLIFVALLWPVITHAAQQVGLRSGDHDGYTRLVFDWPAETDYTLERGSGSVTVRFSTAGTLDAGEVAGGDVSNILGLSVRTENPLAVAITIPPKSSVRDFSIGSRIILDITDPPGGPVKEQPQVASANSTATQAPVVQEPELAIDHEIKTEAEIEPETEPDVVSEVSQESPESSEEPGIESLIASPNLVSISATQSMGMAVFETGGQIIMANDMPDLLLRPQISGPDAAQIAEPEKASIDGGVIYSMPLPGGAHISTQGGGLLWRIIMSPEYNPLKPVYPVRQSEDIIWPFDSARKVLDWTDPATGEPLKIVTVGNAQELSGQAMRFVHFDVLPAAAGLVIRPRADDLSVEVTRQGAVRVSRPSGLVMVDEEIAGRAYDAHKAEPEQKITIDPSRRIFNFGAWEMGGLNALNENRTIILADLPARSEALRVEGLLTLGRMFLANAQGAEALGFLRFAADLMPDLEQSPEFIGLRGAARAIDGRNEGAFEDLSNENLAGIDEVAFWRAFILANAGDWQQAQTVLPDNTDVLYDYPAFIINRLGLALAEIALRKGEVDLADEFLDLVEDHEDALFPPQEAAMQYLRGEKARQAGDSETTKEIWSALASGPDDLYRVKAGLALTRLLMESGEVSTEQAIDKLERLRYAWRGDELEAQINYWLGRTYFEKGEYARGLNIMRDAATFATAPSLAQRITSEMTETFTNLFLGGGLEDVSPLDAAALYDQFPELVPAGVRGDKVLEMLVEHLVRADLLGRASQLLEYQINHRLSGFEAYRLGVRLAAIYLLDDEPAKALESLERAENTLQSLSPEMQTASRRQEIDLLRARALSRQGRPEVAVEMLREMERSNDVNRLRADIAWNAGYWDDAEEALEDVIIDRKISLTRPLDEEDMTLILHRAVALNLASNRIALANLREKFGDAMAQTPKAKAFEVVTRPRRSGSLADRDTLMSVVSEVDLFSEFLNSYRTPQTPSQ